MVPSSKVIQDSGFVITWVSADGGAQISIALPPIFALAKRPSSPRKVTRYWELGDYTKQEYMHYL